MELENIEFKNDVRNTLDVYLLIKESDSSNDFVLDVKKYSKKISKFLYDLAEQMVDLSKSYDSLMNYYLSKCSKDTVEEIKQGFIIQREGIMMIPTDYDNISLFGMVTGNYLNLLFNKTMKELGFSDNILIGYVTLWNFCNLPEKGFKKYLMKQARKRIKILIKEGNESAKSVTRKSLKQLLN